jgi:hypothetical protein
LSSMFILYVTCVAPLDCTDTFRWADGMSHASLAQPRTQDNTATVTLAY